MADIAKPGGLQWYAAAWPRRARQLALDAAVAVWVLAWTALGVLVHGAVSALVPPAESLAGGASDVSDQLGRAGDGLARLPLVGDEVGAPLQGASSTMRSVATSATQTAELVGELALLVAVLLPLGPVLLVLALWLPVRLRFARRAGAARTLLAGGADPQLFALRALATRPLPELLAVSVDPVGDWRRGDEAVTAALARLELAGLGVAPGRLRRSGGPAIRP